MELQIKVEEEDYLSLEKLLHYSIDLRTGARPERQLFSYSKQKINIGFIPKGNKKFPSSVERILMCSTLRLCYRGN